MSLVKKIEADTIIAMKEKHAERTGVLRMMKAAIKSREIEKRAPLTDSEVQQVLTTMVKQRHESVEQFTKGGRKDLAEKETWEIGVIEQYLPKAASESEIRAIVNGVVTDLVAAGGEQGPASLGVTIKAVQAKIQELGLRADGRMVSELVKARLAQ